MLLSDTSFFFPRHLMRYPLIKLFHLFNLFLMPEVVIELFGTFSCSGWRISFDDGSQLLSTSASSLLHPSSSKLLSPLQNVLNHHCTVHLLPVPGPNALLMLRVISSVLQPGLNLIKKII